MSSQNRLDKADKERKRKFSFCSVPTRRVIENLKKKATKFKKLKNIMTATFQAKIGWNFLFRAGWERNETIIFIFSISLPFPTYFGFK